MNWRRGLLLAGVNVAIALPMISILALRDAQSLRDRNQRSGIEKIQRVAKYVTSSGTPAELVRVQEEQTVTFNLCELRGHGPVQVEVVQSGNLPAWIVSQWRVDCPPKWSIARILGVNDSGLLSLDNFKAMRRVDVALCLLTAVQWFLIGGFPFFKARRWWSEPGAFITLCTAFGSGIALIPFVEGLARLAAVFAFFGWLWYFALLLWKPIHFAWQSTLHVRQRLSN